jgi:hypothetical protein
MPPVINGSRQASRAGQHEKAAHHAHTATGHAVHARSHAEQALKAHVDEHGKK